MALTVIPSHQPARPAPFPIDELRTYNPTLMDYSLRSWSGLFNQVDRVLRWYEKRPLRWLREAALNRAEAWIVRRQERDGSWGGIQPPWVNSILALTLRGYPLDRPTIARALEGLDSFTIDDGHMRGLEACQSPVWDTALAIIALTDAGTPDNDACLIQAADWLLEQEVRTPGDWAVRRPGLQLGGWAFEFANDNYPDVDDTAEVGLALRRVRHPDSGRLDAALVRARGWIEGMQSRNGGWGAFDADNTNTLCRKPSFRDFGEVIDPPSADVTARALHFLAQEGALGTDTAQSGLSWLRREQETDGSWFGRWGANHIYGLSVVIPALVAAGAPTSDPALRRAVAWLEAHQNADGGWGEDLRSYDDTAWIGRGASTASQTAWALMALLEADAESPAVARRGVPGPHPARGRNVGRRSLHRHRLPRRLLHQISPLSAAVSIDGIRAVCQESGTGRGRHVTPDISPDTVQGDRLGDATRRGSSGLSNVRALHKGWLLAPAYPESFDELAPEVPAGPGADRGSHQRRADAGATRRAHAHHPVGRGPSRKRARAPVHPHTRRLRQGHRGPTQDQLRAD